MRRAYINTSEFTVTFVGCTEVAVAIDGFVFFYLTNAQCPCQAQQTFDFRSIAANATGVQVLRLTV